jgi:UDP-MurNAc hydroxylase
MKFKFIGNAGGIFIGSKNSKILCDPWIIDGVFDGSWFHYPPLKTKLSDLQNIDGIYVSHIHPDHFDERFFEFKKDIPLIILNEGPNFLKKNLIKLGYSNFLEIKNNETVKFREFNLTMYKPFTKHIYEESLIGNLIDSALVLNENDITAINFNDNTPDEKSCWFLKDKFKKIDLAMLNYNAAGPYPSCFDNLSTEEKKNEHKKILDRNFNYLTKIIPILNPKTVLPFAGAYIIGGKNYQKNNYLGTTTWDECSDYLRKNLKILTNIICLRENQIFDIKNQKSEEKYKKIDLNHMKSYIESLKTIKYEYELDNEPDINKLKKDIEIASEKLLERIKKYSINIKSNVFIRLNDNEITVIKGTVLDQKLYCKMDNKLLRRILDKKSHWNNAEIGTHISFERYPNRMEPDVHTVMSFFHL